MLLPSFRICLRAVSIYCGTPDLEIKSLRATSDQDQCSQAFVFIKLSSALSLAILFPIAVALHTSPQKPLLSATNTLPVMSSLTSPRKVPGDSPARYVGDPSNDLLDIEALDLVPKSIQVESPLCQQQKVEITQNGTRVCPPRKDPVLMEYSVGICSR